MVHDTAAGPKQSINVDRSYRTGRDEDGDAGMGQTKRPENETTAEHATTGQDTTGPDMAAQGAAGLEAAELEAAREEYRRLAASLAEVGLVHHGSIVHRFARPDVEGPETAGKARGRKSYYQWTSKVAGKTISRTLSPEEATLYREWITNDRELRSILKQMRLASEHATNLILKQKVK